MRDYLSHEVRNVAVMGHSGSGKTAVLEAMLYFTKASDRFGKTSEGSSLIDYDSEEIRRGHLGIYLAGSDRMERMQDQFYRYAGLSGLCR